MIQKWEHEKFIYLIDVYIVRKYVVLIMEWYVHFVFICVAFCIYLCTEIPRVSKNMCCIACSTNDVISSGCTQNPTIDDLHVRLTFNLGKTNKIFYYS